MKLVIRSCAVGAAAAAIVAMLAACSTGAAPSGRDWSRHYNKSLHRVWETTKQSLHDLEYELEDADRANGRIRALSSAERETEAVRLDIRIVEREEEVRVHVQASGGVGASGTPGFKRIENRVVEFLNELDARLD
jgi:hypothetical protein